MMAWEIKHIFDGDYGCEELQPGEKAKVSVTLVNEKGETKVLSVEDQWLLDKNLSEGSIWPEQTAFIKYHLSPQKCSPFQGASSACPRQRVSDKEMARKQGVAEELKARGMLRWVGKMNNIRACADEIVLNDIVYS